VLTLADVPGLAPVAAEARTRLSAALRTLEALEGAD
jgi:hypothetical protein